MKYDLNKFPTDARFVCNKDPQPPNRLPEGGGGGTEEQPRTTFTYTITLAKPQASAAVELNSSVFWVITWRTVV